MPAKPAAAAWATAGREGARGERAPDARDEPAAGVGLELERLVVDGRRGAMQHRGADRRVRRQLPGAVQGCDGDRRALAVTGLEVDAHPVEAVGGDDDRAAAGGPELLLQLGQPVERGRALERLCVPVGERVLLELEIGDQVARDPTRGSPVEPALDVQRVADRDLRQPAGERERCVDPGATGGDPGGDERGAVQGEHARGDHGDPGARDRHGRPVALQQRQATQTIVSEPSTATLLQNSVRAGAIRMQASSPTETA